MTRVRLRATLVVLAVLGAAARLFAWRFGPGGIHPDEIFQTVEPAWWQLHGAGLAAWEWRDGVRSWVLPAYHGGWMGLLDALGVPGFAIGTFLQLHWAALNLLLVPIGFASGAALTRRHLGERIVDDDNDHTTPSRGWQGGLLAAAACALFPLIATYAPHTLSESPSMLCLVGGLALATRLVERADRARADASGDASRRRQLVRAALVTGFVISLGVCLRVTNGPLALVAPLWLLQRRHFALVAPLIVGALLPVLAFGLVDLVTWGKFLGSYLGYIRFNFIEGRAADFGVEPWHWYAERLFTRAPVGLPVVLLALLLGLRTSWPFALSALGLVALLSTQAHKEERFVIAFWPFALIGAAGFAGALWARGRRASIGIAVAALTAIVAADNLRHPVTGGHTIARDRFAAQIVAARDPRLSGLVVDSIFWTGGSTWLGRDVLITQFHPGLLANPMISHALVTRGSDHERAFVAGGFEPIYRQGATVLLRRP